MGRAKVAKPKPTKEKLGGDEEDFPTPIWCVDRLLEEVELPRGGEWLEPCAGGGNIIRAVRKVRPTICWTAVELQEKYRDPLCQLVVEEPDKLSLRGDIPESSVGTVSIGDFLEMAGDLRGGPALHNQNPTRWRFDVAIMNPPFTLLVPFVEACRQLAPLVICLARMNWLASAVRHEFFSTTMPEEILVLPNRPSFAKKGKTDMQEYAWMIFTPRPRAEGRIRRLALTPKDIRCPPRPRSLSVKRERAPKVVAP